MDVVDDGCLNSFKAGIHKRWRSDNLDVDVFDGSLLEQDADGGFAYERVARDSIDDIAACGVRTEHSLDVQRGVLLRCRDAAECGGEWEGCWLKAYGPWPGVR